MNKSLFLWFLLATNSYALNFVVYITLVGSSHLDFMNSLTDQLMAKGHNVDVVVGVLHSGVKWQGKVHGRRVDGFGFDGDSPWVTTAHLANPFEATIPADFDFFYQTCYGLAKAGIESGIPVAFMKNDTYDAALVTDYDYAGYIYAKAAGITKVMSFTSVAILKLQSYTLGLPTPASLPTGNLDYYSDDVSLVSKMKRLFTLTYMVNYQLPVFHAKYTDLARKQYGSTFPSAETLARDCDIAFINSNELIEHPRVVSHKAKYIGGIGRREPKPLTEEFEAILQKSKKGTVIVSFGTLVPSNLIPRRIKEALVKGFTHFPDYTFIWKYTLQDEDTDLLKDAKNVKAVDWLPQNDLLHDPRVVGFVSHCGLNSLTELTHAGVPVVAIPLVSDQTHNGRNVERLGIGVKLDKLTLSDKDVIGGLEKILFEEKYKKNSAHLAQMLADHPEEARNRFVKWAEFGARHENIHKMYNLREAELSPFVYYCIDVILILLVMAFLIVKTVARIVSKLLLTVRIKQKQQ